MQEAEESWKKVPILLNWGFFWHQHIIKFLQLLCVHEDGYGIQGIGFFVRIMGQLRDIFFLDFRDGVPDSEAGFHILDGLDKA